MALHCQNHLTRQPPNGWRGNFGAAVAVCVIGVAALVVPAPAQAQFRPVPGQEYREVVDARRAVSGTMVVGISVDRPGADYGRQLQVWVPEQTSALELRVDIDSADARFSGSGLFTGSANGGGWLPLTLLTPAIQSRKPEELGGDALSVAVRASGAPTAAGGGSALMVSGWSTADLGDANTVLRVQINSRRGEIYAPGSEPGRAVKCERVSSPSTVRFDTVCRVRIGSLERAENGLRQLRLLRRDGSHREPVTVQIWL